MKVSIVMPSLNQSAYLRQAIDSVLSQDWPAIELVIMDGGSTDGSVEYLSTLRDTTQTRITWHSDPDDGPAQAINDGMALTTGDIVAWLNADDLLLPGAVSRTADALATHEGWLLVYGRGEHIDERGRTLGPYPTLPPTVGPQAFRDGCFICQPTVFFRRDLLDALGERELLDTGLKAAFDMDLWLRVFLKFKDRVGFIDTLQARSRLHPACITRRLQTTAALEALGLVSRHLDSTPLHWIRSAGEDIIGRHRADQPLEKTRDRLRELFDRAEALLGQDKRQEFAALRDALLQLAADYDARLAPDTRYATVRRRPIADWWRILKHRRVIRRSAYFDETWYRDRYPAVRENALDPAQHYLLRGAKERLDPSPAFSTAFYLDIHPDVRIGGLNPLVHFELHGRKEGRMIRVSDDADDEHR